MLMTRTPQRLRCLTLLLCCVVAMFTVACGVEQPERPADTFAFALGSDPETFDPGSMSGSVEGDVAYQLFEGLLAPAADDGPPEPGVAERYVLSADGRTYTFHLRPDARWSNGDPLTAADFDYAWRRVLKHEVAADYISLFRLVRGAAAYEADPTNESLLGLRVDGPTIFVVELAQPVAYFPELVSFYPMFPVHRGSIEKWGQQEAFKPEHIVSNGAYKMEAYLRRLRIDAALNPHYWGRADVSMKRLSMLIIEDEAARVNAFDDGRLDWVNQLPSNQILSLRTRDTFRRTELLGTYFLRFNVTKPPFHDPRVRHALSFAVDRELLCRCTLSDLYKPAAGMVPSLPGYPASDAGRYDPDEARRLLAAAGFPGGKGFPTVTYLYNTSENHKIVAEGLQDIWKTELGIEVQLVNQEWKVYLDALKRLDFDIARGGWIGDYVDPNTFLNLWRTADENNHTGWSNTEFDGLIDKAAQTPDPTARLAVLRDAEAILLRELPVMPIYNYAEFHLLQGDVEGWKPNLRDVHLARHIRKRPQAGAGR
jgi:oligopeptide transport system substrate-binding protein